MREEKCKKRRAVILFADIINSSELANSLSAEEYDGSVREFQETMIKVLEKHHVLKKNNDKRQRFEASIRGDEICLILYSETNEGEEEKERTKQNIKLALLIAIEMKRKWLTSNWRIFKDICKQKYL
jgi:class 3 adenylate cyclase